MTAEQKAKVPEKYIPDAQARVEKRMIFQFVKDNVLKDKELAGYYKIFHFESETWTSRKDFGRALTSEETDMYKSDADAARIPLENPNAGPDQFRLMNNLK